MPYSIYLLLHAHVYLIASVLYRRLDLATIGYYRLTRKLGHYRSTRKSYETRITRKLYKTGLTCVDYAELNALALMYSSTIGQVHLLVLNMRLSVCMHAPLVWLRSLSLFNSLLST